MFPFLVAQISAEPFVLIVPIHVLLDQLIPHLRESTAVCAAAISVKTLDVLVILRVEQLSPI